MYVLGLDIGGTKCAVIIGESEKQNIRVLAKRRFPTPDTPTEAIRQMMQASDELLTELALTKAELAGIGISCGGPLDSREGVIQSPPNLPGWDNIEICDIFARRYGVPVHLQNDANACAYAEWKYGAGRGTRNMLFLTFGTGLGAGLILDGRLYVGTNDMAGEVGHVRLEPYGPVGYGKSGSFEGFCSGSGIAQMGRIMALERIQLGDPPALCESVSGLELLNAKVLGDAAEAGDAFSLEVYRRCGEYLGRGLAVLVDILNPELIVLGSIFVRSEELLRDAMLASLAREALPQALRVCGVVPAALGESLGDIAALSVATL